jgi:hypothetical protein
MSKERELLREIMCYIASGVVSITSNDLGDAAETLHEIQELLAQPEQENFGVFKAFLEQLEFDIQQDNIKRLVLCMRQDNKSVLAQAVLDYMKEINAPIDMEKE